MTDIILSNTVDAFLQNHPDLKRQLEFTCYASDYCKTQLQNQTTIEKLIGLTASPVSAHVALAQTDISAFLDSELAHAENAIEFDKQLRLCRQLFMCRIIWRDVNRLASMQETCESLSYFAEAAIQKSLRFHYQLLQRDKGTPRNSHGIEQALLVIGMGKLGAWELNLSSDIDLIFCFTETGETDHPKNPLSNFEFFSRLGKNLIKTLDAITAEGFVFRVDMRLRPYGQSGALVSHFRALEDYYQTQGREWERYAMVKARVVANSGEAHYADELVLLLRNFTYRKYVDFSVIDALRKLKELIRQEVLRHRLGDNIKLGTGGIREVEFIAQVFQLIRGGRDTQLQDNRLNIILPELENIHCLPEGMANDLWQAYTFLRNTEHCLQAWKDEQTQTLPNDPAGQERLATVMGYHNWDDFFLQLEAHRHLVHAEFQEVITPLEQKETARSIDAQHLADWRALWLGAMDEIRGKELLKERSHEDPQLSYQLIHDLRTSGTVTRLHASGRERLDDFFPRLLFSVSATVTPTETLARILQLVKAVVRRSAYLLLLIENPKALEQLVTLSVASPWIANELAHHPALLDELLDQRTLYHPPDKQELEDELRQYMLRVPEDDLDQQMETLRYFRSSHGLRVAACEITGTLPLMKVSDYLTWLAETILRYVLQLAWKEMTLKHGYPDGNVNEEPNFVVLGYGKLGGIELGHGSDLDLVFLYEADSNGQTSGNAEGKRQLENAVFYMRLGQKIIHILNTNTPSGQLYEVDMRLRPSGNSGMLVCNLKAFEKYQRESAWTWEHQALVRARVVAGSQSLGAQFEALRACILAQRRDPASLAKDVIEMRHKMYTELGSDTQGNSSKPFHLKQDPGGIVDIEFMVQYAVLAWAENTPELTRYTDNIRILECLAQSGLLGTQEVNALTEAYKAFRSIGHRLTLQQQSNLVDDTPLANERQAVKNIWQQLLPG